MINICFRQRLGTQPKCWNSYANFESKNIWFQGQNMCAIRKSKFENQLLIKNESKKSILHKNRSILIMSDWLDNIVKTLNLHRVKWFVCKISKANTHTLEHTHTMISIITCSQVENFTTHSKQTKNRLDKWMRFELEWNSSTLVEIHTHHPN